MMRIIFGIKLAKIEYLSFGHEKTPTHSYLLPIFCFPEQPIERGLPLFNLQQWQRRYLPLAIFVLVQATYPAHYLLRRKRL